MGTIEELLTKGEERNWPAVRLRPNMTLLAGEENWRKYLGFSTEAQQKQLHDALWKDSEGPGCVGIVR